MKRSHSGPSTEEEKRYSKVQTGSRELNESESQRIIVELEKEVEVLQKQDKSRNDLMKLKIMNWVPEAITETHNKCDSAFRLLRKANLQLMEYQGKLKIPVSASFVNESEPNENPRPFTNLDSTDDITALKEKVTSLEEELGTLKALHACCSYTPLIDDPAVTDKEESSVAAETKEANHSGESRLSRDNSPAVVPGLTVNVALGWVKLLLISGPTLYPLPFPQGANQGTWFEGAFAFVNINLGGPYTLLIECWVELERLHQWQGKTTGLTGKNIRPAELTSWIDSGRYGKRGKKIVIISACITAFGEKVWTWWMYLQPEWRKKGTDNRPLPVTNF
ncbi:hypothetical protein BDP27DRAFT_1429587 [Rhodocollybia butyracea]|uniref:Uncharacterized protein n=1 Tax=Rhodocollybia butyracea TaxID=206335 RepID=A0A9P5TZI4_9AGAR|nr:hypothetical protein BDP27DRAFT_1429587 [Rhodocollybia butyracea]